ncbi:MAG: DUF2157 domain-containing protein [Planctomycetota bacterium]|jgi:uncharacterized membrane protein
MSGQDDKIQWLGNQLSRWTNENLIDENTADKIRQLYPQSRTSRPWAMIVFSGIGACVIGLGIILLFAYNWADMSKFTKLAIIFGSIAISHSVGITTFLRSERFKALGEALTIIGTMLFGSGIWLIAQIYHIEEHFPNAFLFWGIGAALLAWTMPSIAQAVIAAILFTLWAIMEGAAFGTSVPYIFGLLLLLFPLAYIKRNGLLICVLLLALGFSTLFVVAADSDEIVFYSLLSLFTLYTATGIIQQKFSKFENFGPIYRFLGLAGYFLTLFILCFTEVAEDVMENIELFSGLDTVLYWAIPFVLALAGGGIIGRNIIKKVKLKYYSHDLILMPLLLIFFCCYSLSLGRFFEWPAIIIFNLIFLAHVLMMMASGCKEINAPKTILGSVGLAVLTIARFTDLFDSLAVRGLIFVVVGILIFVQGFFYVSSKKKKAQQENT